MNNTQDLTQLMEEKSVPVSEQWEVSGYERINEPRHCVCGHKLRKLSFTIRNTLTGKTISPLGSGCIKKIENRTLTTEVNKLLASKAPTRIPCRVKHCTNTTTTKRYQMCTDCKPKCMPAGLERPKVGENRDTFDSIIRSNPKLAEWLLGKHFQFKELPESHGFYKTNNYRRAYAYNELEHYHPNRDT
jgi:hypothetical protein